MNEKKYILAFDSANEVISIGVGELIVENSDLGAEGKNNDYRKINAIATREVEAHRASNTRLIPEIDNLLDRFGISRSQIACVAAGRGPGSFTGVRICLATAKGIASALRVGLVGVSTIDSVAWGYQNAGYRGHLYVAADAMRKEVYPVLYKVEEDGVCRLSPDKVLKAKLAVDEVAEISSEYAGLKVCGDALVKYREMFVEAQAAGSDDCNSQLSNYEVSVKSEKNLWSSSGIGLLLTLQDMWQSGEIDPLCPESHNPGTVLPVYTRLSDAEETERARLADTSVKNLNSGVQNLDASGDASKSHEEHIQLEPLDAKDCDTLAKIEAEVMGSDAWHSQQIADELGLANRSWWVAKIPTEFCDPKNREKCPNKGETKIIGYAGGMVAGDTLEVLKVAVLPNYKRRGVARLLLSAVANDARDLGASKTYLEVRAGNINAQMFYKKLGLSDAGAREKYYSDGEDATIMTGPLPIISHDVGGMHLRDNENVGDKKNVADAAFASHKSKIKPPIIFAIESSCDETAAAISCNGEIIADVVASQVDFHKRFGGVVPEIASRKHIEAICGVADECFEQAAMSLGIKSDAFTWENIDAVAVTYAPGLVGALVVGMAFAKGTAWAADKPLIGVNHLEGHLYANKLGESDRHGDNHAHTHEIQMPAVASVISGGNTLLVQVNDWGDYKTLGSTIDDAVGEAFDKVAKALCLGYPGGPIISKLAATGDPRAINFPRAMMRSGDLNFSLSGLKTAVITHIEKHPDEDLHDLCASFQAAVIEVQVEKARTAIRKCRARSFMFGGGVAANPALRAAYAKMCEEEGVELIMPPLSATGDNAAMIALVANDRFAKDRFLELHADVAAHAPLDKRY